MRPNISSRRSIVTRDGADRGRSRRRTTGRAGHGRTRRAEQSLPVDRGDAAGRACAARNQRERPRRANHRGRAERGPRARARTRRRSTPGWATDRGQPSVGARRPARRRARPPCHGGPSGRHDRGDRRIPRRSGGARRRRRLRVRRAPHARCAFPRGPAHVGAVARRHVLRRRLRAVGAARLPFTRTVSRPARRRAQEPAPARQDLRLGRPRALRQSADCESRTSNGGPAACSVRRPPRSFARTPRSQSTSTARATFRSRSASYGASEASPVQRANSACGIEN